MKIVKRFLSLLFKIPPMIVVMPILMMSFGLLGIWASLSGQNDFIFWVYLFITVLFIFIPTTTFGLVMKKFKHDKKRRNALIKRMAVTSIGTWVLLLGLFIENWRSEILFIFGFGGFLYFLFDYIKQGRLYLAIKSKPIHMIGTQEQIESIMETKCSRSVLYEYTRYLKDKERQSKLRKMMKKTGYRFWHLHPTSRDSLTSQVLKWFIRMPRLFTQILKLFVPNSKTSF